MLGRIGHRDAEIAGPLVEIKDARLEDRRRPAIIEVAEVHEVRGEHDQVAVEANEFFHRSNPGRLRLQLAVAGDERGDRRLGRPPKDFSHPDNAQSLDTNSRFGPQPRGMRSQAILKSLPLLFGKALAVSQERHNGG